MILQQLFKDHDSIMNQVNGDDNIEIPSGFVSNKCHWKIVIDPSNLESPELLPLNLNAKGMGGEPYIIPSMIRTSGSKAILLCDNQNYVFGITDGVKENITQELVDTRHKMHMELLQECYNQTNNQAVGIIINFLNSYSLDNPSINDTHRLYFVVKDHQDPLKDQSVIKFWQKYTGGESEEILDAECSLSGQKCMPITNSPSKIKVPGNKDATYLVSANNPCDLHYNCDGISNLGISLNAIEKAQNALNTLLSSRRHFKSINGTVYVYWSKQDLVDLFFDADDPKIVSEFLSAYETGTFWSDKKLKKIDKFNIFGLHAESVRLSVRFANKMTIEKLYDNQYKWLKGIQIIDPYGNISSPSFYKLIKAFENSKSSNKPNVENDLLLSVLLGTPITQNLVSKLISRINITVIENHGITHAQAALLKLYLSNKNKEYLNMNTLNPENPDVAYQIGRLFCILENTQNKAQPEINSTITDKYWSSARQRPAQIIGGTLLNLFKKHVSKLQKDSSTRSLGFYFDGQVGDILAKIGCIPSKLTLDEQAMFALGYYHQKSYRKPVEEQTS